MSKTPQPGDTLEHGKYRLVRELGRGNMGTVFLAEHTLSHKRCAIKYLHPERVGTPHALERMVLEARAAARVEHPHAVAIHDVGRDGEAAFLVMEYLEGETLKEHFAQGPKLPHAIVAMLIPGMRAVDAAHRRGVIHRDIKPENIFLARVPDTSGLVTKILDFGVSKLLEDSEQSLTIEGSIIGTPMYMSYEQLIAQPDIDRRTDVYAFGVVLYEALTGQLPHSARSLADLAAKMREAPPVAPKALRSDLPSTLSNLLLWALKWDRGERIESLEEFIRELEPFSTPQSYNAELTSSGALDATELAPPRHGVEPPPPASREPGSAHHGAGPIAKPPNTAPLPNSRRAWPWVIAAAAFALVAYTATLQTTRPRANVPPSDAARVPSSATPSSPRPAQVATELAPPPAREPALPASPPVEPVASPPAPPVTAHPAKSGETKVHPPRKPRSPGSTTAVLVPTLDQPSAAVAQARERRAAEIARLREQLVLCGDLVAEVVRAQCKERTKRELAEREEDYELADQGSRRKP